MLDSRRMSFFQRAANRLGTPWGIIPFPFAHVCEVAGAGEKDLVFERIYKDQYWTIGESASGLGSELAHTSAYRRQLLDFLERERIGSFFDAPCGDLNWMSELLKTRPMDYIGADISESALELARQRWPTADLRRFDICRDSFPDADVWHCRDTLFHFSFRDIWDALENAAESNVRFALITTHRARVLRNIDISTGSWRYLDLERPPFNLPQPQIYLSDYTLGEFPRFVGIWPMDAIRTAAACSPNKNS